MPGTRRHHNVTLSVLILAVSSYVLMQSLVVPALSEMQAAFDVSETAISWVLTAYLLSATVATPIVGRLGDMYGKRRVLLVVVGALGVGTVICALASSLGMMIAGRLIQGIGGGMFPLAFAIIRDEFPEQDRSQGIGLMSALLGIGGAVGVLLAGPIVDAFSYHWLFWFSIVLIVPAIAAVYWVVPESPVRVPGRINWLAGLLLSAGLVIVLLTITDAPEYGWGSARTLGGIAIGLAVLGAWVGREVRSSEPLVDMTMMRIHGVWTTNLVAFLVGVGMYAAFILVPAYVQEPESTGYGFGASVLAAGFFLIPCAIIQVTVGQLAGRIERRVGSKPPLLVGCSLIATSFVLLVVAREHEWAIYVASALLGGGLGLAFAALANLIVENVRQDQTGVATGMNTVARTLGGAVGAQVVATLLADHSGPGGLPTFGAYGLAFGFLAAAVLVGVAVATLIPRRARVAVRAA